MDKLFLDWSKRASGKNGEVQPQSHTRKTIQSKKYIIHKTGILHCGRKKVYKRNVFGDKIMAFKLEINVLVWESDEIIKKIMQPIISEVKSSQTVQSTKALKWPILRIES